MSSGDIELRNENGDMIAFFLAERSGRPLYISLALDHAPVVGNGDDCNIRSAGEAIGRRLIAKYWGENPAEVKLVKTCEKKNGRVVYFRYESAQEPAGYGMVVRKESCQVQRLVRAKEGGKREADLLGFE